MFEGITPLHILVVLIIALIILGPGKLPEVGAALGKSIREFRRSVTEVPETTSPDPSPPVPDSPPVPASPGSPPSPDSAESSEPPTTRPLP
jgi:sec-independent protein translocase protein TatA